MRAKRALCMVAAVVVSIIAIASLSYAGVSFWTQQSRVEAARQLIQSPPPTSSPATPTPSAAVVTPSPSVAAATPVPTPSVPTPSAPAPTSASAALVYPIQGFSWPAAGIKVATVTMDHSTWQQQAATTGTGISPPLDNGFDRVGHWLEGTGPTLGHPSQSVIIAAHTCFSPDASLCNDATFPFRRLSYDGWAVGQRAAIVDAVGHSFDLVLVRRQLVPKVGFMLDDDPCEVQVFSCTEGNTHNTATLVTFRRTSCAA